MDTFTQRRLIRAVENIRSETGQLPTLKDFEAQGFDKEAVKAALKLGLIEEFYVTLTSGSVVKGFKLKQS
jgi:hypothetical protein